MDVTFLLWQIREALFWFLVKDCCQNQTWECWLRWLLWGCLCGARREHSKFSPRVSQGFTGDLGFRSTSPSLLRIFLPGETSPASPELVYCNSAFSLPAPEQLQDDKRMCPRRLLHSLVIGTNFNMCLATAWFVSKDYQVPKKRTNSWKFLYSNLLRSPNGSGRHLASVPIIRGS